MLINKGLSIEDASEKTGISEKTARKYVKSGKLPEELRKDHNWRTREDPFKDDNERIKEMLGLNCRLEAKTEFEYLQQDNPYRYSNGQLRTLQRKFHLMPFTQNYLHSPRRTLKITLCDLVAE